MSDTPEGFVEDIAIPEGFQADPEEVPSAPPPITLNPYERARMQGIGPGIAATTGPANPQEIIPFYESLQEPAIRIPRLRPQSTLGKIAAAPLNVGAGLVESAISPVGALSAMAGGPVVKGLFSGLAAKGAGEALGEASVTKDPGQIAEGVLGAGLAPFIALHGSLPPAAPRIPVLPPRMGFELRMPRGVPLVRPEAPVIPEVVSPEQAARAATAMSKTASAAYEPGRLPKPEVPGTPAEARETVLETIRRNNARTRRQIQQLFPARGLSNEEAAELRNEAWGPPELPPPKPKPTEAPPEAIEEPVPISEPLPAAESSPVVPTPEAPVAVPVAEETPAAPEVPPQSPEPAGPPRVSRSPVPIFLSGINRNQADINQAISQGIPIGVTVTEPSTGRTLSPQVRQKVTDYLDRGGVVFLDSGAIDALRRGKPVDWGRVLFAYREIINNTHGSKDGIYLAAPDVVGDLQASKALQTRFEEKLRNILRTGANIVYPVQKQTGVSLIEAAKTVPEQPTPERRDVKQFGDIILGIPFHEKAWGFDDVQQLLDANRGKKLKLHLLGGGDADVARVMNMAKEAGVTLEHISGDRSITLEIRARKYGAAPVTKIGSAPLGDVPKRIEDTIIAGKTLDEWEAAKTAADLPRGNARADLARWLAVPNQPSRILQALGNKKRTREIHAPPAPIEQITPIAATPAAPPVEPETTPEPVTPPKGEPPAPAPAGFQPEPAPAAPPAPAPAAPAAPKLTPEQFEAKSQEFDRLSAEKKQLKEDELTLRGKRDAAEKGSKEATALSEQIVKNLEDQRKLDDQIRPLQNEVFDYRWAQETAKFRGQVEPEPSKPKINAKVLKAQRDNLLEQVDKAIKDAPDTAPTDSKILLSVPGDGDFNIINSKEKLKEFRDIAKKYFPTSVAGSGALSIPTGRGKAMPKAVPPADADLPAIGASVVSTDETRFAIQTGYADGTQIVSTDGRQLLRIVTPKAPGTPAAPVRLDEKGKITEGEGNYPNYNQIINASPALVKGGADTSQLWTLANQALVIWKGVEDKAHPSAKLYVNPDGSLGLSTKRGATGDEYSSNIQNGAKWAGDYNPAYLLNAADVARRLGNEKVDLYVYGENGPLEVRGQNHQYIVMPMRTSGESLVPIRDNPNSFTPGQKVHGSLPIGFGPLRNPESLLQETISSGNTKYSVTLEGGKFKVEQNFPKVGAYGSERWESIGTFPLEESGKAAIAEALTKEGKTPAKDLVNRVYSAVGNLSKERRGIIEEGQARLPSKGPGAAAAAEFDEERPDPEVLGIDAGNPVYNRILRGLQNFVSGFSQLGKRRLQKRDMEQLADAADNIPRVIGQQAGNSIRLRLKDVGEQRAVTALMQSLKMSGQGLSQEDAARLGDLEFAGDPIGYLRAKKTDLSTLAQQFINEGKKLEAQAAIDWANAMGLAASRFNQLRPIADLAKRKFDRQLQREAAAGIDVNYENWYVPQRHELDLMTSANRPIILGHSRGSGTSTGFKKAKVFEDYATAIENGFVPRSLSIADLLEHRVSQGEKLIARKAFFDSLKGVNDEIDGKPIVMKIPRRVIQRPDGSVDVQETVPLGYSRQEVIPGYSLAVHDGYSRLMRALTASSQISESAAIGTLQDIAAVEKHIGLALDTFHASRTLQTEFMLTGKLSLGQRQRLGRALVEYSGSDLDQAVQRGEITQEMADYIQTPIPMQIGGREVRLSPKAMLNLGLKSGVNIARFADVIYRDWLREFPITGRVNKWVFDKMTRSAIGHGFIAEFQRVAAQHPEWDAKRVGLNVTRDINVLFGNLQKESIFRNPSLRAINQIVFLAPQWVESLARREGRAVLQLGQAAVGLAKGEGFRVGSVGKAMGTGLAAYLAGTQLLNLITRGHLTFSNEEEGHKLDAWIPDLLGGGTKGFFISPLSVFGEITHDLIRFSRSKPDLASAISQIGANKLGNLGRALGVIISGRDPLTGEKIIGTARRAIAAAVQAVPIPITVSALTRKGLSEAGLAAPPPPGGIQRQITASAGFKTEPVPSAQNQIFAIADRWKQGQGPKLAAQVEQRLKEDFGPSRYKDLRMALQREDFPGARRAYQALRQGGTTPDVIRRTIEHPHPFAGSAALESRFRNSLTPQQHELYRKALEERRDLTRRFRAMLRTKE